MKKRRGMVVVRCDGCGMPVDEVEGSVVTWFEQHLPKCKGVVEVTCDGCGVPVGAVIVARHLPGCHAGVGAERGSGGASRSEVVHMVLLVVVSVVLTSCGAWVERVPVVFRHPTTHDEQTCVKPPPMALGPIDMPERSRYADCKTKWEERGYVRQGGDTE